MTTRKQKRNGFSVHVANADGRTKLGRFLKRAERMLKRIRHHEFDVGLAMVNAVVQEHNWYGSEPSSIWARRAAERQGDIASEGRAECMERFVSLFSRELVPAL